MTHPAARSPGTVPREDVSADDVAPEVRRELRSLGEDRAERVALHLASAQAELLAGNDGAAVSQVDAAMALAARLGVVREAAGLVHYQAADFARALRELRAARRLGAGPDLWPVIVDCERALGRAEHAIELAREAADDDLDRATAVELAIVVAGIRRDRAEFDAGLRSLELPELRSNAVAWVRLRYSYADLLEAAGRRDDAEAWFSRVARADTEGETDAADRVLALQGIVVAQSDDAQSDDAQSGEPAGDDEIG